MTENGDSLAPFEKVVAGVQLKKKRLRERSFLFLYAKFAV